MKLSLCPDTVTNESERRQGHSIITPLLDRRNPPRVQCSPATAFENTPDCLQYHFLVHAAVEQKLAVLNDVRESIEITQTGEYVNFLRIFFPAFMHVLRSLPMSTTDDNNHKTRNTLLEILNRCFSVQPALGASQAMRCLPWPLHSP